MTNEEEFKEVGEFVKFFGKKSDRFNGCFCLDLVPEINLCYDTAFGPTINVRVNGDEKRYNSDNIDKLIKDLREELKYVGEFYDWIRDSGLWT